MQKILKKQITLHIILTSIIILNTSTILTCEPNINDYSKLRSVKWFLDDKEYIINPTDREDAHNKKTSIENSNFLSHCALIISSAGVGAMIGNFIGSILGLNETNATCAGALIGETASVYIIHSILPKYENKPMHTYLEQKQAEYKQSLN